MTNENEEYGAESFDIEDQDQVSNPQMESFDDGKKGEYMDTNIKVPKFLDLNNPNSYSGDQNSTKDNTNQKNQFTQSMNQNKAPVEPNFTGAIQQQKNVKSMMGMMNKISGSAAVESAGGAADGTARQSFPVNIQKLKDAINALEGLEYWLPPQKGNVRKLRIIAQPVIDALKAYVKNLS
jgi:hypothetical protein